MNKKNFKTKLYWLIYLNIIPRIGWIVKSRQFIPVIYYHNIVANREGYSFMHMEVDRFAEQMKYLKEQGYQTYVFPNIPDKLIKKNRKSKEVIITFDDGFLSNYSIVFPIMRDLGLKYNIFVTAKYVNGEGSEYLNWDTVKEMADSGLVGFGAHTYTHIDARDITERNYKKEIVATNQLIQQNIGKDVPDFCFPYGFYNRQIIKTLSQKRVYHRLYTSDQRNPKMIEGVQVVGRVPISNDYDLPTFARHVAGDYGIIYYYYALRGSFTRRFKSIKNENN